MVLDGDGDGDGVLAADLDPAVPATAPVIAADGGLAVARHLGLRVDEVVGDLDSAPPELLAEAEAGGARVRRYPMDKDATDGQLALARAVELATSRRAVEPEGGRRPHLLVLGPGGGRLDQLLADVALLGSETTAPVEVTARFGAATLVVVRPGRPRTVPGPVGATVSLLPLGGSVAGVVTHGLRWALAGATLQAGTTWGVSNEVATAPAEVAVAAGVLLAVLPGAGGAKRRSTEAV